MTTNVVNFGTEYENYDYDGVLIERLATVEWILINEKRSVQMQFDTISALPILLPPPTSPRSRCLPSPQLLQCYKYGELFSPSA